MAQIKYWDPVSQSYKPLGGLGTGPGGNVAPQVQVFSASGTWTKPANMVYAVVELVGGGGGGGGAAATAAAQCATGGGGGGGGYAKKTFPSSALGATVAVTVGTGGSGTTTNGVDGNASIFGASLVSANGGGAGSAGAAIAPPSSSGGGGGTGGMGMSGDVRASGSDGRTGWGLNNGRAVAGGGGGSVLGGGTDDLITGTKVSKVGLAYGGGGSGGANAQSQSATAGANGADGVVIVTAYF